jgi:hypothetical protein
MIPREEPGIGDLIYCYAVGSPAGWFINQIAIVVNYHSSPTELDQSNFEYRIYLPSYRNFYNITSQEFEKGNADILSKVDGTMTSHKTKKIIKKIERLNKKRKDF